MLRNKRIPFFLYDPEPSGGTPPAPTPTGGGGKIEFTAEQQAHIDKLLGDRAKRAEQSALADFLKTVGVENADALKAALDEGKKLKGAQMSELEKTQAALKDWETKFAERDAEAKKIPDLQKELERVNATLKAQVDAARKDLPKHIGDLLDKLNPVEQLEYLIAHADELGKKPSPIPPTPNPADPKKLTDAEKEARRKEHERQVRAM